ncbi:MAG TPA: hypothetical protein IGS52_18615 [Oscillatoriaceae cyanobacterium M33_DOE_052]|nr:hypothetical protein [Oscillatoriaceae cyanobacterium M33_DOE_052]
MTKDKGQMINLFKTAILSSLLGLMVVASEPDGQGLKVGAEARKQPWPVQLGLRIAILRANIPTVSRVVLVPDEATFLAAIQQWGLTGRWPILIEDDKYSPLFVKRFQPLEVVRLPSVKTPLPQGEELHQLAEKAVAATWQAEDTTTMQKVWEQVGWEPPGVVIAKENDPAMPAAVALAAAWGQPLAFLAGDFGKPNDTLTAAKFAQLRQQVEDLTAKTGYSYEDVGDAIDSVTLVGDIAVKYESPDKKEDILAVTDGLARKANQIRWGAAGWIYGKSERAIYQAMCSIFLDPYSALLYNSYPLKQKPWEEYGLREVQRLLAKVGFRVNIIERPQATRQTWRRLTVEGLDFDLIFVNSRGSKSAFAVGDGNASVPEIRPLQAPAAIHFIHSWSATTPDDTDTVAGRWLEHGAYAYVGSVQEPYLAAFVEPQLLTQRLLLGAPFLISARQIDSPPWKITTIGDPLMMVLQTRRRLPPSARPLPDL